MPSGGVRLPEDPQCLTGGWVQGRDGATLPSDCEEPSASIDWGRTKDVVDRRTEVVSPPDPRLFEVAEVVGVDLI